MLRSDHTNLKRTVAILFAVVCVSQQASAQTISLSDSLNRIFRNKPVFTAKYDTRNTFITGNRASIWSIKVGFEFRKCLTVGLGYNWLWSDIQEDFEFEGKVVKQRADVRMRYVAPYLDYTFYKKGPWEVTLPVQLGIGTSYLQPQRIPRHQKQNWIMLYEPAMSVEYKFARYFAVGGGYGYLIMLKNNKELSSRFTSPMYVLRFRILFDELYRLYKQKKASDE